MKILGSVGWLGILGLGWLASAAAPADPALQEPVDIRSDTLQVFQKNRRAEFRDHVVVTQGALIIHCQRMVIQYASQEEGAAPSDTIQRMDFFGGVDLEQRTRRGHCLEATYWVAEGRLECRGDPWMTEGPNRIHGERIEYFVKSDEVRVDKPRATVQIPEQKPDPQAIPKGKKP